MVSLETIERAARRLEGRITKTAVTHDPDLNLYLKWESRQVTGSFKIRGALNKLLSLDPSELRNGIVTASAGNHGAGVAVAAKWVGTSAEVFVSEHATPLKLEAMRSLGAVLHLVKGGYSEAETRAKEYARGRNAAWVSAYNDPDVISGQATVALECFDQLASFPPVAVIIPAGGGGLVSGVGIAIRERFGRLKKVIAVQSEASAFLHKLYHGGKQEDVIESESIADGLAGSVEPGSSTIALVKKYVDEFFLVSEEQIYQAIVYAYKKYHEVIEGSGAVALAAVVSGKVALRPALAIITGGNIQPERHRQLLQDSALKI